VQEVAPPEEVEEAVETEETGEGTVVVRKAKRSRSVTSAEPVDREDAASRLAAVAAYWRGEDPYSPAPYLMLRGFRWGEVRGSNPPDANLFEAPPTEVRQNLKRMLGEGSFAEVIELAESTMAEPCGRAWFDLQRYTVTACDNLGYTAIAESIKAELKALVRDFPDLLTSSLLDDTPTANNETLAWIKEFAEPEPAPVAAEPPSSWEMPPAMEASEAAGSGEPGEPAPPDAFQLAMDAARSGRTEEAVGILADEITHQPSGRGRFQRKLQLAQICLSTGQQVIAHSLLEELAEAIDRHQLEAWEAPDVVAHALSLLYACVERTELDPVQKAKLYARICRLDPVQALKHHAQAFAHGR
jgi:type VI secretion system protein ImpA